MPVNWFGDQAQQRMRQGGVDGVNMAAEVLLGKSNAKAPVDTTDLRQSGSTHQATLGNPSAQVSYNTPYAVIQHERTDFHHPTDHNPGAQAKYLETPLVEDRDELTGIIAEQIRRSLS